MVNMQQIKKLYRQSPPLTVNALVMIVALVASLVAMLLDDRRIGGVNAWLKPTKFHISTILFSGSIAWLYGYLDYQQTLLKRIAWIFAAVLYIEIVLIDLQAFRGKASHFNNGTGLDRAIFSVMGAAIGVLLITTFVLLAVTLRHRFEDRGWGWALRLGLLLSAIGSATGGLMVTPTSAQIAALKAGEKVSALGAHTVGAPDGGPGVPGVNWSAEHGDLRIPHFIGLHALQAIPFLVWFTRRRRVADVFVISGSYAGLYAILLWQALRGESIAQPGSLTLEALGLWVLATAIALATTASRRQLVAA